MRKRILLAAGLAIAMVGAGVAIARPAFLQSNETKAASAEVKIGLGIEKMELTGAAERFKVAAGTRIYAWTKVTGCADTAITMAFFKGGVQVSKQDLTVPRSPYRTNAYRTFRLGDEGEWTVKVLSADGAEIGAASFGVEVEK